MVTIDNHNTDILGPAIYNFFYGRDIFRFDGESEGLFTTDTVSAPPKPTMPPKGGRMHAPWGLPAMPPKGRTHAT